MSSRVAQTTLLSLCERGHLDKALCVLPELKERAPNSICVDLLKLCIKSRSLEQTNQVHSHLKQHKVPLDGPLGEHLVVALAKCGAIQDALHISHTLPYRGVFSWTAIISAFVDQGNGRQALETYQYMLQDGVQPNKYTFVSLLKACGSLKDLEFGRRMHADARRRGFLSDVFVGSTLVSMYGKCGATEVAEVVFNELHSRSVVTWNVLLSAYVDQGLGYKALQCYKLMQDEGVSPDELTLVLALQAGTILAEKENNQLIMDCKISISPLEYGLIFHKDAHLRGFVSDTVVSNTMISMYGKCRALAEAEYVFACLSEPTTVSWRAMLSAYVDADRPDIALQLFHHMKDINVKVEELTLLLALQACSFLSIKSEIPLMDGVTTQKISHEIGKALHAEVRNNGFTTSVHISSILITMYSNCGDIVNAESVFTTMHNRNVVSWNAMISAYVDYGQGCKALQLFEAMQQHSVNPIRRTYVLVLQACLSLVEQEKEEAISTQKKHTNMEILKIGHALHTDIQRCGFTADMFVCSSLVTLFSKFGMIGDAEDIFNKLVEPSIVLWTAMLSAYTEAGQERKALLLYDRMLNQNVTLNDVTIVCVLQACSATGSLELCKQVNFCVVSAGYDLIPTVAATLIHTYGSCASMTDAIASFGKILEYDIVTWNACLAGHTEEGNFSESLQIFENLKAAGVKPNETTFTLVLSACSHSGLVMKALEYFESMKNDYGITPILKHYGSMLDLLGRTGDFHQVEKMLQSMPMQANTTILLSLIEACRKHGNTRFAVQAFKNSATVLFPS